jgi:hypothetical protein
MPARDVLHERDALALGGAGDDHRGTARSGSGLFDRLDDLAEIVPVDLSGLPAERRPFRREWIQRHDLLGVPVGLQVIGLILAKLS